jgi:L-cysteine:1D-myo-inositol 2-amino-2-deoxy-alpha-D-glucopyranoside ligase
MEPIAVPNGAASTVRIHDTLTRRQQPLPVSEDPERPGHRLLRLYVCGVTPYDSGHLGHASTFCAFDNLIRWVEASGVRVRYVQNVTDVDDPLFERAHRDGIGWDELARRETTKLVSDMAALGWRPPDVMPRVSEEIPGIVDAVTRLAEGGYAYQTDALYFDTSRYPRYGELSHRTRRSMLAKLRDEGLLGEVGPHAKRDALDFPLWRPSAPGEPAWETSFGPGRPGWHIECSAMSMRHLGLQVDIHGGGRDLVFSHHESERAQSESLTGCLPFARAWMHVGIVRFEGHKMSKSLGNLVLVPQLLERVTPATARLYLASRHYRPDWEFRWPSLERTVRLGERLAGLLGSDRAGPAERPESGRAGELSAAFAAAMDSDLDTASAVRVLRRAVAAREESAARWMASILCGEAALR